MTKFVIKKIREESSPTDGYRVLVDRLWPRGISKERANLAEHRKDLAPSTQLRKWWNHETERFAEFTALYVSELAASDEPTKFIAQVADKEKVTLLFAAHDPKINHAVVLADYLAGLSQK